MTCSVKVGQLQKFRRGIYRSLGHRRDALFEMIDATSCGGAADSLPHLSLLSIHQRRYGSVYAALREGTLNAPQFRGALVRHPLAGGLPAYAVDVSVVARCDAEDSPARAY